MRVRNELQKSLAFFSLHEQVIHICRPVLLERKEGEVGWPLGEITQRIEDGQSWGET